MTTPQQPTASLYHLTHLAIIEVNGEDAGRFLQGQLTCDINGLSPEKASIAAFCNAKGRMISTLLVIKTQLGFFLIVPAGLLDIVTKKLQMYVLRAKVKLAKPENLMLAGLNQPGNIIDFDLPTQDFYCSDNAGAVFIKMPSAPRFLCVAPLSAAERHPFKNLPTRPLAEWRFQDISVGLPWFEASQSEQYIPQMLNIDQLDGISFSKGCYTGQEIVARTHYLGKAKRQLHVAEVNEILPQDNDFTVKDAETQQKCGDILALASYGSITRLLIVLQTVDDNPKNFILDNQQHTTIKLLPRQ